MESPRNGSVGAPQFYNMHVRAKTCTLNTNEAHVARATHPPQLNWWKCPGIIRRNSSDTILHMELDAPPDNFANIKSLLIHVSIIQVTTMESLPPEILRKILFYLVTEWRFVSQIYESALKTSLAVYATISCRWQSIVEPFTFRRLILDPMRLDVAEAYHYLTPARLAHI
ncbi:hypothetical protein NM208_g3536 [Fusarium decemcellulare]|uniref:Uncharacterized protein n=1 Tax=Fusarium decemcellulare TaxID=57161 RepID=A0ACC1SNV3_9HYPO|nr:hypothetical protein NM208_g3536 [Fusarium decemcellulare]